MTKRTSNPVLAKLEIWDLENGKVIREHDVNNVKSSRDFVHNTIIWALSNGHGVQMHPPGAILPSSQEE